MATVCTRHRVRYDAHVAADLTDLAVARDALADALDECSWGQEDTFRVLICADEAMANAFDHGSTSTDAIDITFRVDPGVVTIVVTDHCSDAAMIPTSAAFPIDTSEHGRGLILMRALSDRFRMWHRPTGTMVALGFRADGGWAR